MRIGLVVYGGVHRSGRRDVIPALLALIEALARRHELHVFALAQEREPSTYPLLGATVHSLAALPARRGLGVAGAVPKVLRAVRSVGRLDVLHAYMGVPAGAVASFVAPVVRVPLVVTFDGNELVALPEIGYGLGARRQGRVQRRVIRLAAARITVCTSYMADLARKLGIEPAVIPLGIDPRSAPPGPPPPEGPPWRLLHVASLNPVKDQPTLLKALTLVRRSADVELDVVGHDTLGGAIQAEAARLGLADRVRFHGALPADEVWPFYRRAHLHLLPSRHDAAGVAVLEAALCAVPTVGTNVGYMAEWALQGAARATPVGDAEALAGAIVDLLRDPAARQRAGKAARTLVLARDAAWTADRFEDLYRSL